MGDPPRIPQEIITVRHGGPSRVDALVRWLGHIHRSRSDGHDDHGAAATDRVALVAGSALFLLPTVWMVALVDLADTPVVTLVLATLAYAAASTVEFEVGSASAVPTQPLLVVMLLLLPPGLVPLAVFAGLGLGSWWIREHRGRSEPLLATACSAAHAVGPGVVLVAMGPVPLDGGSARLWLVLAAALLAQVVCDVAASWVRNCLGLGVVWRELWAMLWWSFRVDLLLVPLGAAAALAFPSGPMAVGVAVTPVALLAVLAGDRRRHIDGMIELSSAFHDAADTARRDQLTGLGNRRAWDERVATAERHDDAVGVVMLDVDWLKVVNDDFGHDAGDRLLRTVAGVLAAVTPEDAAVCRLGGDEFGVLLDGDQQDADRVAGFIRAGLAACDPVHGTAVSASIGTAAARRGQSSVHAAIERADRDIYRHKAARGRSRSRPRSGPRSGHGGPRPTGSVPRNDRLSD